MSETRGMSSHFNPRYFSSSSISIDVKRPMLVTSLSNILLTKVELGSSWPIILPGSTDRILFSQSNITFLSKEELIPQDFGLFKRHLKLIKITGHWIM